MASMELQLFALGSTVGLLGLGAWGLTRLLPFGAREEAVVPRAEPMLDAQERAARESMDSDPELLRGHDLLAARWLRDVHGQKTPALEDIALIVMAATLLERDVGRAYDGRPLDQGWMCKDDYANYFDFLDAFGPFALRKQALLDDASFYLADALMACANNKQSIQWPAELRHAAPARATLPRPLVSVVDYWRQHAKYRAEELQDGQQRA
jgi:hypothetical protein